MSKNFVQNIFKHFKFGSSKGNKQNPFRIFLLIVLWLLLTMMFFFWVWLEGSNEEDLEKIAQQEQKLFPFETLVAATKDFHITHKLGEGGFGPVFKVRLRSLSQLGFPESLKLCLVSVKVVDLLFLLGLFGLVLIFFFS